MENNTNIRICCCKFLVVSGVLITLLWPDHVLAQVRTTPVEVENAPTVKIDSTDNTVKSQQSGAWNVSVSSIPVLNVNTHPVTQSGTWNVGVTGTPTVKIDSSQNTVRTQDAHSMVTLFPGTTHVISPTYSVTSPAIDCRGFKEMRVNMSYSPMSQLVKFRVLYYVPGSSGYPMLGYFPGDTKDMVSSSKFVYHTVSGAGGFPASFVVPVVGEYMKIGVVNDSASSITVHGDYCFVYLVN